MEYGIYYAFALFSMLFIHLNRPFLEEQGPDIVDDREREFNTIRVIKQIVTTYSVG